MEIRFLLKKWKEWESKSKQFTMLFVSLFKIANVLFWDFSITNVKFKHGKVEETQFWEKNLRKFNSLKIKEIEQFEIFIVNPLLKHGGKGVMNILFLGANIEILKSRKTQFFKDFIKEE